MIRRLESNDKELYFKLADEFYHSEAVLHPVPKRNIEATFDELMRSDVYTECFIIESDGSVAGYALISKTFSQEAGGYVIWVEELFIRPEYRGKGLGNKFFDFLFCERPAARYRLEIEPDNVRAAALYKRRGFDVLGYGQMVNDK